MLQQVILYESILIKSEVILDVPDLLVKIRKAI